MFWVLATYPNAPESRFDQKYYRTKHVQFALDLLKPYGLQGIRISCGLSGLDGSAPRLWAVGEMRFSSRADFDKAMAECGASLFEDTVKYTDVEPVLQVCTDPEEFC